MQTPKSVHKRSCNRDVEEVISDQDWTIHNEYQRSSGPEGGSRGGTGTLTRSVARDDKVYLEWDGALYDLCIRQPLLPWQDDFIFVRYFLRIICLFGSMSRSPQLK